MKDVSNVCIQNSDFCSTKGTMQHNYFLFFVTMSANLQYKYKSISSTYYIHDLNDKIYTDNLWGFP